VEAQLPILAFYGLRKRKLSDDYTAEQKALYDQFHRDVGEPFLNSVIAEFQNRLPHAIVVVIPGRYHYCFIAQEHLVYAEMRKFLLD